MAVLPLVWLKWVPTVFGLFLAISFPGDAEGQVRNNGRYDPFPYRFHGYMKVARNMMDERRLGVHRSGSQNLIAERALRPTFLNFQERPEEKTMYGSDRIRVIDWETDGNSMRPLDFVFVAYTAAHFGQHSDVDRDAICKIGEKAARDLGVLAYWIDFIGFSDDRHREASSSIPPKLPLLMTMVRYIA